MEADGEADPRHDPGGAMELRRQHPAHDLRADGGQASDEQREAGDAVGGDQAKRRLGLRRLHRLEVERRPRVLERVQHQLQRHAEAGAHLVEADLAQHGEHPQHVAIGDEHHLLQQPVRHPRQAEAQRVLEHRAREHHADQRPEPAQHDDREHGRHDQIGQHEAGHAEADADDQREACQQRRCRAARGQGHERRRLIGHPQDMERDEVEADDERVDQEDAQGALVGVEAHRPRQQRRAGDARRQGDAADRGQEPEERARQPLPGGLVRAVVVEPHERGVEPEAEDDLQRQLDRQQQADGAVVLGRQEPGVDRQQQEADDAGGDVAEAVDGEALAERPQAVQHGRSIGGCGGACRRACGACG